MDQTAAAELARRLRLSTNFLTTLLSLVTEDQSDLLERMRWHIRENESALAQGGS